MKRARLAWFARHEIRLAWRDYLAMIQGRRKRCTHWPAIAIVAASVLLHGIAYAVLAPLAPMLANPDRAAILAVTGSAFFAWMLMLSQALESVTRAFYARGDLELVLSSPAAADRLFVVRIGAVAATTSAMAVWLIGPFIDVAAALGGARFLGAYAVLLAMAASATAFAVLSSLLLFQLVGPRRTRLLAQVLAALFGAGFVIGAQTATIYSSGSLSRLEILRSSAWAVAAPGPDSLLWQPARAASGDLSALVGVLTSAAALFALAASLGARRFARNALATSSVPLGRAPNQRRRFALRKLDAGQALRRKEWLLLARDPWLLSQTLMQLLYLAPPALLLWRDFASAAQVLVLTPIVVMSAGQLAGGLAWITLSGEDAPDLVGSAPVAESTILRAKIEAVLIAVALPISPFCLAVAWISGPAGLPMSAGAAAAAIAACFIQFAFRAQAKRSAFRRRQTSSRVATFTEAFSSISMAGAAGLAAASSWLALCPLATALLVLAGVRSLARRASEGARAQIAPQ